ncbi:MAG: methyltransferase [Clostridiales bacterium]|nr:methyltransferase [Clostridiales bacterium]
MKEITKKILANKAKTVPILSFPSTQLLGIPVSKLISSCEMQVEGMKAIANRCNVGASLNMMDLSVEAECFGAKIRVTENEVPTIEKGIIDSIDQVNDICVPSIEGARCPLYINAVKQAKKEIKDVPVFCGVIGPYSLAGRLFDMTELMMECFDSPDEVELLLEKVTEFLINYVKAFKDAGADGVIMAEPAAGLLSPALAEEFSMPYVKKIIDAVSDEDFVFCYHNCGNAVVNMADSISTLGADIYHFGNAISLKDIIGQMPSDSVVMGNVDPILFKSDSVDDVKNAVQKVFDECNAFDNFMISSGCDIPADAKWENLDAYFEKVSELYA